MHERLPGTCSGRDGPTDRASPALSQATSTLTEMHALSVILSIITALIVGASGIYDFSGPQKVLDLMHDLGYRPGFERSLGILKIAGAIGLLLGLQMITLGLLAALGLIVYFVLAVRAHLRLGHPTNEMIPAAVLAGLSALTFLTILFS